MVCWGLRVSTSHADSTYSKLGTRSVVGRAPGNFGGRIWVPSLENMQPGCFGLGRMPRNPNRTGSRSDKLGTWQRNQDAPGKTNRHPKVPSLDDVLSDAAACSGVEAPSKTRSSTCSKLGTLNQHGFPPGILPAIKQIPSLDNVLPGIRGRSAPWGVAKREAAQPMGSTHSRVQCLG